MTSSDGRFLKEFMSKNVLVVEDEYFIADEARRALEKLGAVVVGPAAHVDHALELIENRQVDVAILDIHLDGELVFPVADRLEALDIPYVFATGYDPSIVPQRFSGFVLSAKPVDLEKIAIALFGSGKADH